MTKYARLASAADLRKVREGAKHKIVLRRYDRQPSDKKFQILVCGGTGCTSSGSKSVRAAFEESLKKHGLDHSCEVVTTGCHGFCELGPLVIVYPGGNFYVRVKAEDCEEIVTKTVMEGKLVERLLFQGRTGKTPRKTYKEMAFYSLQNRLVLRNCGRIDPEDIEEYIASGGYEGLAKALEMGPEKTLEEVKASGLRGRGGAGFPTGRKWEFTRMAEGSPKYMCCNADEGDPGAFMDRSVMEGDPHKLLEGMAIAAFAIGADEGYIYVRAEYPLAIKRLRKAIKDAEERHFLGKNIMGSDFALDIHIKEGAGAFVCGEETALIASIEGERGMPRPKPPFPANKGLFGRPTLINNVETLANVPVIVLNGADWFAKMGTETSKGTKTFALTGEVNNTGLIEVPMGTTLRQIVFDIGGGMRDGKKFKAVQIGGPSGGCLTEEHLDIPMDYDNLIKAGAMVGSGGLVVMSDKTCIVEVARFFMNFTQHESCGKCVPCREGTKNMLKILEKIVAGKGEMKDLDTLEELAHAVKDGSLCGLGKTAPNPVLSTLKYFRDEYIAHIKDKKCPAGVCTAMKKIVINESLCKGCTKCARLCPVGAIEGTVKNPHHINQEKCIKCEACLTNCPFRAIVLE